ncbi:hypothetical protein Pmani_035415 [Petrolisthes manimaculis]|uniref:Uncharacterized protein n=1 Tax=Petrolisthes manimaculis TaxID=1843537 RepID=A0AAE1NLQ3_9EUCA|nr:hypothetical protein Pmani_035415 [Petrolisthes manimaculis]
MKWRGGLVEGTDRWSSGLICANPSSPPPPPPPASSIHHQPHPSTTSLIHPPPASSIHHQPHPSTPRFFPPGRPLSISV